MTEFPESDEIRWGISRSIFHPSEDFNNTEQWKQRLGGGMFVIIYFAHFIITFIWLGKKHRCIFLSCEIFALKTLCWLFVRRFFFFCMCQNNSAFDCCKIIAKLYLPMNILYDE